jgi:hypothetical protein
MHLLYICRLLFLSSSIIWFQPYVPPPPNCKREWYAYFYIRGRRLISFKQHLTKFFVVPHQFMTQKRMYSGSEFIITEIRCGTVFVVIF